MATDKRHDDEMREEYDFSKAERGKFYRPSNKRPKPPTEIGNNGPQMDWRKELDELHERLRIELAGRTLPEPEEIIREGREDRDVQLFMALGDDLLKPIASDHGFNWDEMNEEERERFVRKILHE